MNEKNLIWIDLEMTGLNPNVNKIIEIAIIITKNNLEIIDVGPIIPIHQTDEHLSIMDKWNIKTHTSTGLIEKVRKSKINECKAEQKILTFIKKLVPIKKSPMCGNSIEQDRKFLLKYMPELESYFNHNNIDVNSIKELIKRWKPDILLGIKKKNKHKAYDDIKESISEMVYYKKHFFLCNV